MEENKSVMNRDIGLVPETGISIFFLDVLEPFSYFKSLISNHSLGIYTLYRVQV